MDKDLKLYLKLFTSTFYISAFTFGGGYVIIPIMKKKFVDDLHWIEEDEMLNLTAIAQSSPGAVAVNASLLIGYYIGGPIGAIFTIFGTILPPLIIISVISLFYTAFRDNAIVNNVLRAMQAGVAAVISDVVLKMAGNVLKDKQIISVCVMVAAFIATYILGVNVMFIILACILLGVARSVLGKGKVQ